MQPLLPPEQRYARQIRYPAIGPEGQRRLGQARVAIVGVGALGSVTANHLARAGVGTLTLIDRDVVDLSNLQRQMLYDEADALEGKPKAAAAAARLASINRDIRIDARIAHLSSNNAEMLLQEADLIVDGSDNFSVRYLINEVSAKHGIPWIYAGAVGSSGMTMTVLPGQTPCLACLFPEPPAGGSLDTCETAGVLAPIIDTIASIQAMEAIKLLSGNSHALHGALLQIDLWHSEWQSLSVRDARRAGCPVCGQLRFEALDGTREEALAVSLCGRNTIQINPTQPLAYSLERLAARWESLGTVEHNAYLVKLTRDHMPSFVLFADGRALIMGTDDDTLARRMYTDLLGE
ncbi:ThiF family adenylyltransferase [Cohnella yongneupensis]|uniref:ThiF family adenylyltransferase n=1 Tax=Cohnella yongneupensis TaxID=425006 RepID=A0ABW0QX79_9BACL